MSSWVFKSVRKRLRSWDRSMDNTSMPMNYEIPTKPRSLSIPCTQNTKNIRAVVLGKDGVGKTAFTVRLLTKRFIGEYDSTLEDTYRHRVEVDGQNILLEVLDTAGKNSVEKMEACCTADLFFILYSTTDRCSFREAALIGKYLLETKNVPPTSVSLVATKKDLKHERNVTEYDGRLLAMEMGCSFHIISNSEGFNGTQDVLQASVRCLNSRNSKENSGSRSPLLILKHGLKSKTQPIGVSSAMEVKERTRTL